MVNNFFIVSENKKIKWDPPLKNVIFFNIVLFRIQLDRTASTRSSSSHANRQLCSEVEQRRGAGGANQQCGADRGRASGTL